VSNAKAAAEDLDAETLVSQPKPARSAFMCFSDAKQKEFMSDGATKKKELIRRVAEAWRNLSPKVRSYCFCISQQLASANAVHTFSCHCTGTRLLGRGSSE